MNSKSKQCLATISHGLTSGEEMPSLPQIIVEVQKAIGKEETSVQKLAALILDDMSLTGKVLKLANSAYYRRSNKQINTVTQAIILLGFSEIQKMIMAISAYEFFSFMTKKNSFRDIWKHSLCVGLCCQRMAEILEMESPESFLVGGLLHDIGKFVLGQYFPDEYEEVIQHVQFTGDNFEDIEKEKFGCTHLEVGKLIAQHWNLPEEICKVISHHEITNTRELKYSDPMTQIVSIADLVGKKISGYDLQQQKIKMSSLLKMAEEVLDMDQNLLLEIIGGLGEEIYRIAHMLDIAIDEFKIDLKDNTETVNDGVQEVTPESTVFAQPEENIEKDLLLLSLKIAESCANQDLDFSDTCHDVLNELKAGLDLKYVGVFMITDKGLLSPISFQGPDVDRVIPKILFQKDQATILSHTLDYNKSCVLDAELHRKLPYNSMLTNALGSSVISSFPMTLGKKPLGVVLCARDQRHANFSDLERRVIGGCVQNLCGAFISKEEK